MLHLKKSLQPEICDATIQWSPVSTCQIPSHLPTLFNQERLLVYFFLQDVPEKMEIRFTAKIAGKSIDRILTIDRSRAKRGKSIHSLAAKAKINDTCT